MKKIIVPHCSCIYRTRKKMGHKRVNQWRGSPCRGLIMVCGGSWTNNNRIIFRADQSSLNSNRSAWPSAVRFRYITANSKGWHVWCPVPGMKIQHNATLQRNTHCYCYSCSSSLQQAVQQRPYPLSALTAAAPIISLLFYRVPGCTQQDTHTYCTSSLEATPPQQQEYRPAQQAWWNISCLRYGMLKYTSYPLLQVVLSTSRLYLQ